MKDIEIRTPRLALRPLGPAYLETTFAYAGDAEHTRLMMFLPFESVDETRVYLSMCRREWESDTPKIYEFAVLHDGTHIGHVGIELNDARDTAELEWILSPDWQGRGFATEAARALMAFTQEWLGIHRFIAHCDAENAASQSVLRKLGLRLADDGGVRKNRGSDEDRREYYYES